MLRKKIISCYLWYMRLPMSKKVIIGCLLVWLLQAIPKWGFVLLGDGEAAGSFMTLFITPRNDL